MNVGDVRDEEDGEEEEVDDDDDEDEEEDVGDVEGDVSEASGFSFGDWDLKRLERRRKLPLPNISPAFGCRAQ